MENIFTELDTWIAIVLAVIAANCIALGTVLRDITETTEKKSLTSSNVKNESLNAISSAVKKPIWWYGVLVSFLGYAFQAGALVFSSLILVQPIIALTFLFAIPIGAKFANRKVTSYEWIWASLLTVSVVGFIIVGHPQPGTTNPGQAKWFITLNIIFLSVLAILIYIRKFSGRIRASILGICAGILFGIVALLTKQVLGLIHEFGWMNILNHWELYALAFTAAFATIIQQSSFSSGSLHASLPGMSVSEPIIAVALGIILLKESFAVSWNLAFVLGAIASLMVVSIVMLAKHE